MTAVKGAMEGNHALFEQWQIHTLWQSGLTGAGVGVGHLDTGLDACHPAFVHQHPAAFRHFDRAGFATTPLPPFDSAEHGTATASVLCGRPLDGLEIGVAPACRLYSGAVLEQGDLISRILFGMAWLREHKIRVLCMPFGIPGHHPVFASMIHKLRQQGVLVVAPIGNLGAGRSLSPGDYEDVLSVGAVDQAGAIPAFSGSYHPHGPQRCLKPDILAPAVDIVAAKPGSGYQRVSGTSLACVWVAGVVALLLQAAPAASPALIERAVIHTSLPLPVNKQHRSRGGLLQPEAALDYVLTHHEHIPVPIEDEPSAAVPFHPLDRSGKYIDSRLQTIVRNSNEEYPLEAVLIVVDHRKTAENKDPRGAAGDVIDRVTQISGKEPLRTRYIAAANLVIVLAKATYIRMLLEEPQVQVASAADIDRVRLM